MFLHLQKAAANGPSASVPASSPSGSPAPTGSSDETPEIPATPSGSGNSREKKKDENGKRINFYLFMWCYIYK